MVSCLSLRRRLSILQPTQTRPTVLHADDQKSSRWQPKNHINMSHAGIPSQSAIPPAKTQPEARRYDHQSVSKSDDRHPLTLTRASHGIKPITHQQTHSIPLSAKSIGLCTNPQNGVDLAAVRELSFILHLHAPPPDFPGSRFPESGCNSNSPTTRTNTQSGQLFVFAGRA
jgi:hypothetical protein